MTHKVIKIGSSLGITIPRKVVSEKGIKPGDLIGDYPFNLAKKSNHSKLMKEYQAFVAEYGQTLKNLADR